VLTVSNLECVRGERRLFRDIGFELAPGTLLEVAGPNGSGKTSLLRILCGLSHPAAGEVRWRGERIGDLAEEFRRELLYLGHHNALKGDLTPVENLVFSETLAGIAISVQAATEAVVRMGLAGCERLPVRVLSQGQKRRVALARLALRSDASLWILDEPFVALDKAAVADIAGLVAARLKGGGTVVLTTHQEVDIAAAVRQVLRLGS